MRTAGPSARAAHVGTFPVLPTQRRLWLADQMALRNVDVDALRLFGPLDVEALRAVLDQIATLHPAFATTFGLHGGGLVQCVGPPAEAGLEIVDLSDDTREQAAIELEASCVARRRFRTMSTRDRFIGSCCVASRSTSMSWSSVFIT